MVNQVQDPGFPICKVDFSRKVEGLVYLKGEECKVTFHLGNAFFNSGWRRLIGFNVSILSQKTTSGL